METEIVSPAYHFSPVRFRFHSVDGTMLSWPPGLRETDGIWAGYWYDNVARSTSFQPYKPREGVVPDRLREIYDQCRDCYEKLYQHRLR